STGWSKRPNDSDESQKSWIGHELPRRMAARSVVGLCDFSSERRSGSDDKSSRQYVMETRA
ncbi:hypothetical protein FCV25MIE_29361, partial [Fagus crenata]